MIVHDLPPAFDLPEHEGEVAFELFVAASQVPAPQHQGGGRAKWLHLQFAEPELTHLLGCRIPILIALHRGCPAAPCLTF